MSTSGTVSNLFLSPHLDDAVLSCALRLLQSEEHGKKREKSCVATLFSRGWPLGFGPDLYAGRHKEDRDAVATLGDIDVMHLGYKDAIFRHLYYTSFGRIILGDDRVDSLFKSELAAAIGSLVKEIKPDNIFLPLAVGRHIDHRNTHQLWCTLADSTTCNIYFYEDRPYSFLPGNLSMRMHELGLGQFTRADAEALEQGMSGVNFYRQIARNRADRDSYVAFAQSRADKVDPISAERVLNLQPEQIESNDPSSIKTIGRAIAAYTSQMKMLYGDLETFEKETAMYNKILGSNAVYAERYWRLNR